MRRLKIFKAMPDASGVHVPGNSKGKTGQCAYCNDTGHETSEHKRLKGKFKKKDKE